MVEYSVFDSVDFRVWVKLLMIVCCYGWLMIFRNAGFLVVRAKTLDEQEGLNSIFLSVRLEGYHLRYFPGSIFDTNVLIPLYIE